MSGFRCVLRCIFFFFFFFFLRLGARYRTTNRPPPPGHLVGVWTPLTRYGKERTLTPKYTNISSIYSHYYPRHPLTLLSRKVYSAFELLSTDLVSVILDFSTLFASTAQSSPSTNFYPQKCQTSQIIDKTSPRAHVTYKVN